jgi:putative ABC transport system permease protein
MATMSAGPAKVDRQITLPLSQAMRIAFRNITIRLGRAMITGAGTMLGIAFLMSVFAASLVKDASGVVITPAEQQKQMWLVVMSLLVSAVGITNSMLMSVTERYKEIGTMKCLGALDNFIIKLFLIESGLLGFFGALIGSILGFVFIVLPKFGLWSRIDWGMMLAYMGMCIVIGTVLSILAAMGPAMRAAKMHPADAMRTEI